MDVLIACFTFLFGITLGAVGMDWRARRQALIDLKAERETMTKALAAVVETVNPLTQGMMDLRDRVGAYEMRAAHGRATPTGARG